MDIRPGEDAGGLAADVVFEAPDPDVVGAGAGVAPGPQLSSLTPGAVVGVVEYGCWALEVRFEVDCDVTYWGCAP